MRAFQIIDMLLWAALVAVVILLLLDLIRSFVPVFIIIALIAGVGFAWGWLEERNERGVL